MKAGISVLVGCECSGIVRDAFLQSGFDAWSCDLKPCEANPERHYVDDVFKVIKSRSWDLFIVHPPCTYLSSSGLHWTVRGLRDPKLTEKAVAFVKRLLSAPIPRIGLENPVGCISTRIRRPDQYIQPYLFGEDASKKTGLWLKNLPTLLPTAYVEPRMVNGKPRWANQTDSGQNRLGPSEKRATERSRTYPGIATAMVQQWGWILK